MIQTTYHQDTSCTQYHEVTCEILIKECNADKHIYNLHFFTLSASSVLTQGVDNSLCSITCTWNV